MKTYPGIDYTFRPASYWAETNVRQAVLRNVQGTRRRKLLEAALQQGELDDVPAELQQPEVSAPLRQQLGRIHPSLMGGEYLPGYQRDETEIVRIELQSTTSDVISIRAVRDGAVIRYRVVDEYGEEFSVTPETSRRPFTLRQLVRFIDDVSHPDLTHPFSLAYNELNSEDPTRRAELRHFTRIGSDIYPQLAAHYERVFEDWVGEAASPEQEDDPE